MYSGFKVNSSISKSTVSGLNETQIQSLQKQVDTYTRKLQVQKRKYFSIQDQHKSVGQQYTREKDRLNQLKKQNNKAQSLILQSKIKGLQSTLDKAISAYDDTIAYNNRLKGDIDMLRRQKKNYIQMERSFQEQARRIDQQACQKTELLNKKRKKAEDLKQQMMQTKEMNEQQRESYINQFQSLQRQHLQGRSGDISSSNIREDKLLGKAQIIDTQPLLKFRLKRSIAGNKQKQKLIQQYKKHMMSIQQAFNEIKEKSNISDIDQITTTFIKSEEQNYSLYSYMDSLNQSIDRLEEQNREMQAKVNRKLAQDQLRREGLSNCCMQDERAVGQQVAIKAEQGQTLARLIQKIKPALQSVLMELAQSPLSSNTEHYLKRPQQFKFDPTINDRNIQEHLSQLEGHINVLLLTKRQVQTKTVTQTKDTVTPYSKPTPLANYEEIIKEKERNQKLQRNENTKFLDQTKFRQYAIQFWQKRKNLPKFLTTQQQLNSDQSQSINREQTSTSMINQEGKNNVMNSRSVGNLGSRVSLKQPLESNQE